MYIHKYIYIYIYIYIKYMYLLKLEYWNDADKIGMAPAQG